MWLFWVEIYVLGYAQASIPGLGSPLLVCLCSRGRAPVIAQGPVFFLVAVCVPGVSRPVAVLTSRLVWRCCGLCGSWFQSLGGVLSRAAACCRWTYVRSCPRLVVLIT